MPQWNNNDAASNSVSWAAESIGAGQGPANQAANNTALYGNTTANAFITGQTVGQFGVDVSETAASLGQVTHAGWVLVRTGSGGRAGRTTYETLVAMGSMTGDASDDTTFPDYAIYFTGSPVNASANSSNSD